MSAKRKTEFWWASVAGANCEPVEVTTKDGERVAYTCGCADPFYLDRADCPVELVPATGQTLGAMERQLTPKQDVRAEAKWRREQRQHHGWRGPR